MKTKKTAGVQLLLQLSIKQSTILPGVEHHTDGLIQDLGFVGLKQGHLIAGQPQVIISVSCKGLIKIGVQSVKLRNGHLNIGRNG
jgi:hypothetical protein